MYDIIYNGETAKSHGVMIAQRPSIPLPMESFEEYTIPGRDGSVIISNGNYNDISIPIEMSYVAPPEEWMERNREVRKWLLSNNGKQLVLGDDTDHYYQAKVVTVETFERQLKRGGAFEVSFQCDPYQYVIAGLQEYAVEDVLANPYDVCHPTYIIVGNGECDLVVNDNTVHATVGVNLTINTDMMMAYKTDGTLSNTSLVGDYEDLYLQPGDNTIEITDGFEMTVIPHWRRI